MTLFTLFALLVLGVPHAAAAPLSQRSTVATAVLSGTIWHDQNENGFFEAGEGGVPGVTIQLLNRSSQVIRTVTTDSAGNYAMTVKTGDAYFIRMLPPAHTHITTYTYRDRRGTAQTQNDFDRATGLALDGKNGFPLLVADYGGLGSNDIADIDGGLVMRPDLAISATATRTSAGGVVNVTVHNLAPTPALAGHAAQGVAVKITVPTGTSGARIGTGSFVALPSCALPCSTVAETIVVAQQPYTTYSPATRTLMVGAAGGSTLAPSLAPGASVSASVELRIDPLVSPQVVPVGMEATHHVGSTIPVYDRNYANNLAEASLVLK